MVIFEDWLQDAMQKLLVDNYEHLYVADLYVVNHEYHEAGRPGFISFLLREFADATYIDWKFLIRAMVFMAGDNVTVGCYTGDNEEGSLRVTVEGIDVAALRSEYSKLMKRGKKSCTKARRIKRK